MYLITTDNNKPFITKWYTNENNFQEGVCMVVYDLNNMIYTIDGKTWDKIELDHL